MKSSTPKNRTQQNTSNEGTLVAKIFIGIPLSSKLRLLLSQSFQWKQAKITHTDSHELVEVHHQSKDYIGQFFNKEQLTLKELKLSYEEIEEKINTYCPLYKEEPRQCCLFTQIFIS